MSAATAPRRLALRPHLPLALGCIALPALGAMPWGYRALVTALTVLLALAIASSLGRRFAGIVAGLPVITAPSLLWVAQAQGAAHAAKAAYGSIAAVGLAAVFAVTYERLSRRHGPAASLAASLAVPGLLAVPLATLAAADGMTVVVIACVLCIVALWVLPRGTASAPRRRLPGELLWTGLTAGVISAAIGAAAGLLPAFWCGLLATLPLISSAVLVHQHLTATSGDRQAFLRGYVAGLLGKIAFALTLALGAVALGIGLSMCLAVLIGAATALLVEPLRRALESHGGLTRRRSPAVPVLYDGT